MPAVALVPILVGTVVAESKMKDFIPVSYNTALKPSEASRLCYWYKLLSQHYHDDAYMPSEGELHQQAAEFFQYAHTDRRHYLVAKRHDMRDTHATRINLIEALRQASEPNGQLVQSLHSSHSEIYRSCAICIADALERYPAIRKDEVLLLKKIADILSQYARQEVNLAFLSSLHCFINGLTQIKSNVNPSQKSKTGWKSSILFDVLSRLISNLEESYLSLLRANYAVPIQVKCDKLLRYIHNMTLILGRACNDYIETLRFNSFAGSLLNEFRESRVEQPILVDIANASESINYADIERYLRVEGGFVNSRYRVETRDDSSYFTPKKTIYFTVNHWATQADETLCTLRAKSGNGFRRDQVIKQVKTLLSMLHMYHFLNNICSPVVSHLNQQLEREYQGVEARFDEVVACLNTQQQAINQFFEQIRSEHLDHYHHQQYGEEQLKILSSLSPTQGVPELRGEANALSELLDLVRRDKSECLAMYALSSNATSILSYRQFIRRSHDPKHLWQMIITNMKQLLRYKLGSEQLAQQHTEELLISRAELHSKLQQEEQNTQHLAGIVNAVTFFQQGVTEIKQRFAQVAMTEADLRRHVVEKIDENLKASREQMNALRISVRYLFDREDIAFPQIRATPTQLSPLLVAQAMEYLLSQQISIDAQKMDCLLDAQYNPMLSAKTMVSMKNQKIVGHWSQREFQSIYQTMGRQSPATGMMRQGEVVW